MGKNAMKPRNTKPDSITGIVMHSENKKYHKGQILSNDLVISLSVLMAIILISFYIWGITNEQLARSRQVSYIEQAALFASDSLVQTAGSPSDWEYYNLNSTASIGLASERNVISLQKAAALSAYNNTVAPNDAQYYRTKELLGVGKFGFRFDIVAGKNTFYSYGEPAPQSFNNSTIIQYVIERPVIYNNTVSNLIVSVWQLQ